MVACFKSSFCPARLAGAAELTLLLGVPPDSIAIVPTECEVHKPCMDIVRRVLEAWCAALVAMRCVELLAAVEQLNLDLGGGHRMPALERVLAEQAAAGGCFTLPSLAFGFQYRRPDCCIRVCARCSTNPRSIMSNAKPGSRAAYMP